MAIESKPDAAFTYPEGSKLGVLITYPEGGIVGLWRVTSLTGALEFRGLRSMMATQGMYRWEDMPEEARAPIQEAIEKLRSFAEAALKEGSLF